MADEIKYNIAVTGTSQAATNINAVAVAQQNLTRSSANAGVALQNLNFVIRDSPYFFRDFSLGILAVGNNLNPLIDSMLRMKREAQEVGQTLSGALWASLKGPAGVVLAFSALVTVLQAVTFAMSGTKKETKQLNDELEKQYDAVDKMSRLQMLKLKIEAQFKRDAIMSEAARSRDRYMTERTQQFGVIVPPVESFITKEQQKELTQLDALIYKIDALKDRQGTLARITNEINDLKERQNKTTDPALILSYEKQITGLQNLAKELRGVSKEHKDYLDMVALGYAFATEREEDLFQKRMDLLKYIRESAIRGGVSPEQAEAFAVGMSGKLQGEKPGLPVGFKKLPEHPLKDFWKDQDKGNNLLKEGTYWAHQFGRELVDAFKDGKFEADKFFNSLLAIVAELSLTNLITGIFTGGTGEGGLFTSFKPSADTSSISSNGSLDKNVTFVFENVIDGQKIIYKGIKEKQAALR